MEDSGFDSDQKLSTTGSLDTPVKVNILRFSCLPRPLGQLQLGSLTHQPVDSASGSHSQTPTPRLSLT